MTELFKSKRRIEVLDNLTTFFKADQNIAGLVLVGSAAEETQDIYSGLDLLVVIANGSVFPSVYRKWKTRLSDLLPAIYKFEQVSTIDSGIYSIMLEDYLEVNLYFMPLKNLVAEHSPWQVLFDQTQAQDIKPILEKTYQVERISAPTRVYRQMMASIWQPILKCVAAVNRGEVWRALHMLDQIRNQTIQLAAMNYGVDTRNYSEVDQLPEMLLIKLRHTLPTGTDHAAIRRALNTTTELFFQQAILLEENINLSLADEVHTKMQPYIEAYS
jgi:predicted nucleotidyltransferase